MNKKLIAIAVAAGLAPMAAQAAPTVYGHGQVEYGVYGGDIAKGSTVVDNARGRIGVKNSEDLGNGMTALFKAEFKTDFTDGTAGGTLTDSNGDTVSSDSSFTKREMMVGIKAGFGTISAGRLKSPYKYTGGVKYDPFVTTTHEARGRVMSGKNGNGSGWGNNGFVSDAVGYQGKFGGLSVWAITQLDDGGPKSDTGAMGTAVGVKFSAGNFEVFAKTVADGAETDEYKATSFGGQFKAGPHKISAQLESTEGVNNFVTISGTKGATAATDEVDYMFLNYQMKMGKNVLSVSYGTADAGGTDDYTLTTVGVIHKFSKKTRAFVAYSTDDDGTDSDNVVSLGLRVDI